MKLTYRPYTLQLKRPFGLASGTRSTTPIVLVELEYKGLIGYGEASLPPYYPETPESVIQFLSGLRFEQFEPTDITNILTYRDQAAPNNNAAKAAVDIALHDLVGKIKGVPCHQLYGVSSLPSGESRRGGPTSYTIAIDNLTTIPAKIKEAADFKILKVKLGTPQDRDILEVISGETDKAIYADANQGWKTKEDALEMLYLLKEYGYVMVEQPMPVDCYEDDMAWLKENSPLPILADESVKRLADLEKASHFFHGVNIKLMKSTGLAEAYKMVIKARELNMQVMIGCMTETSCATLAAAHLSPLADYVDLDGAFLINNNPFQPPVLVEGCVVVPEGPGIGISKI